MGTCPSVCGGPLPSDGKGPVYQAVTLARASFLHFCELLFRWGTPFCFVSPLKMVTVLNREGYSAKYFISQQSLMSEAWLYKGRNVAVGVPAKK